MARTNPNSSNLGGNAATSDPYEKTQLPHLLAIRESIEEELAPLVRRRDEVSAAIAKRVAPAVAAARKELSKTEGTVRAAVEGCEVKSDVPKKVEWDSDKLKIACEKIVELGEDPSRYVKFELSVPERKYDVLPEAVLALVKDARTLKHGKEKLEVTLAEKAEAAE